MTLDDTEFIRRFALHILPKGFMKIRHYGILSSTSKKITIPRIREQVGNMRVIFNDERKLKIFNNDLYLNWLTANRQGLPWGQTAIVLAIR